MPETNATLHAQQAQMLAGHRKAQLFPGGKGELPRPHGIARTVTLNGDVFHFNPARVSVHEIHAASHAKQENSLLGLGPVSKHEAMRRVARGERPLAIVERSRNGTELRAAAGTHSTAAMQMAAMNQTKSPTSTLSVEHPAITIAHRAIGILNGA